MNLSVLFLISCDVLGAFGNTEAQSAQRTEIQRRLSNRIISSFVSVFSVSSVFHSGAVRTAMRARTLGTGYVWLALRAVRARGPEASARDAGAAWDRVTGRAPVAKPGAVSCVSFHVPLSGVGV